MTDMVSAALGSASQGPQLFWSVIAYMLIEKGVAYCANCLVPPIQPGTMVSDEQRARSQAWNGE